ncbi:hypothetical protein NEMIN01_1234 [Nematocida minor]|uniref:uncharacterized protein n=1 Tax=Nematocida minor TaxID=1912983 RepID=UPI00221FD2D4|nr:uncharacterized protein NEMIN01_1234 [Nematocida minor]KAI5190832.1 hypothetical protein NEMIN01_1234 [Nematocida minor]
MGTESAVCSPYEDCAAQPLKISESASALNMKENKTVIEAIFQCFKSCSIEDCPLNSPYTHPISLYSNLLFCVMRNHRNLLSFNRHKSFKIICDFEKIILLAVQLDRTFRPVHVGKFDLLCEQDIESLTFKLYESMYAMDKSNIATSDYYHILEILLNRKEYERFFVVYEQSKTKTIGTYKLSIVAALCMKEEKIPRILTQIKNDLKLKNVDIDGRTPPIGKQYRNLVENAAEDSDMPCYTEEENLVLFYTIKNWYIDKYREHHWNVSIHTWHVSRNTEGASEAMIDRCIRLRKYEEGWDIYKESTIDPITPLRMLRLSRRILSLIIHAINNCNTNVWVEKYLEIATVISRLNVSNVIKVKNTFSILSSLKNYAHISCISVLTIKQYPEELISNSAALGIIFEDIYKIFKDHEEVLAETQNESCTSSLARHALIIYRIWRKKNSKSVFLSLFWGRSKESVEVYTLILQIAAITKNKDHIISICKDIWEDSIAVTENLSNTLSHIHSEYSSCSCDASVNTNSRGYLMHVLSSL